MPRLVSLAAGTILDVTPVEAVGVAAEAGFGAVGIWFDPTTWKPSTPARIRSELDQHQILAFDIEPIMLSAKGDHGDEIVDAAVEIGVQNILVASREPDHAKVAARLNALAERIQHTDIKLVLEFLPILAIKTLADALSIVESVNHKSVGVLIDSLHLARSGSRLDLITESNIARFAYLQICDGPAVLSDPSPERLMHEALHGRLLPGEGGLDLHGLLRKVPGVPLSFELRSEALLSAFPDPIERAQAVLRSAQILIT